MKIFLLLLMAIQSAWAGGNTCVVSVEKVKEITITEDRIVIRGDALTVARMEIDKEHGKDSVYGRPAQDVYVRSFDGEFVVIPYFSELDYKYATAQLSDRREPTEAERKMGKEWWVDITKSAREIKVGDAVEIGYQGGEMSIVDFKLARVIGPGTASVVSSKGFPTGSK